MPFLKKCVSKDSIKLERAAQAKTSLSKIYKGAGESTIKVAPAVKKPQIRSTRPVHVVSPHPQQQHLLGDFQRQFIVGYRNGPKQREGAFE